MPSPIRLEYANCLRSRIGERGLEPADVEGWQPRLVKFRAGIENEFRSGQHAYRGLPSQDVSPILEFAAQARQKFEDVLVIGIGGSSLGGIALHQALHHPFHNLLPRFRRGGVPRLHFMENADPDTALATLEALDQASTLAIVVTKSGSTSETIANYMLVHDWMRGRLGDAALPAHIVAVTDPEKGELLAFARKLGLRCFVVPPAVGGRFSVFTPVGLLPAALTGIDIQALLQGAASASGRAASEAWSPASAYALMHFLFDRERGIRISVLMPYADKLDRVADWYRQLWAESLGKRLSLAGKEVHEGPTPVRALGAIDQHSQVQLYVEGPCDKLVTFVRVEEKAAGAPLPSIEGFPQGLAYLSGHALGELLNAEQAATAYALAEAGRPSMTLHMERLDAFSLGELLMTLQLATTVAGKLYDVDPYDQPGVEAGKKAAYALMGRAGYESHAEAIRQRLVGAGDFSV